MECENILNWYANKEFCDESINRFCYRVKNLRTQSDVENIIYDFIRDKSPLVVFRENRYYVDKLLMRRYRESMEKLLEGFRGFKIDDFYKKGEEAGMVSPYPVIVLSGNFKDSDSERRNPCGCKILTRRQKYELYGIMLGTPGGFIKHDPTEEDKRRIENLFYSDCIQVMIHPKSTLIFYQDTSKREKSLYPCYELDKYKFGIINIIETLRIQWFCYIRTISKMRDDMHIFSSEFIKSDEFIREGRFEDVGAEMTHLIEEINNLKDEVSSFVELPSMKVSNSQFPDILKRGIEEFDLDELYKHIKERQQRMDMLCTHAMEFLSQYSGLHVEDRMHATNLVIEFLESAVVGFGVAEIVHFSRFFENSSIVLYFPLVLGSALTVYPIISWFRLRTRSLHGPRSERVRERRKEISIAIFGIYFLMVALTGRFYHQPDINIVFGIFMSIPIFLVMRAFNRI